MSSHYTSCRRTGAGGCSVPSRILSFGIAGIVIAIASAGSFGIIGEHTCGSKECRSCGPNCCFARDACFRIAVYSRSSAVT